jgi:hypothetical protein
MSEARISYWDETGKYQADHKRLWDAHVPASGESKTIEGELIRAIGRLFYEYCNNGNCNAGEWEEEDCPVCDGSGFQWCDSEEEDVDCSYCGGECKIPNTIQIKGLYGEFLNLIKDVVGCEEEVEEVKALITNEELHYNYTYSQEELDIYNILCDKVIEYVLEKEKTGFTPR